MLAGLVASGSPLPYTAVAVIPLGWAGVESVRSMRARADAQVPTRALVSSVVSLVLICLLTVIVLLPYAFYGAEKRLQDCYQGANTAIAAADCRSLHGGIESTFSGFLSSGKRAGG